MEKELWVRCPRCKQKTRIKVYQNTVLLNFPLYGYSALRRWRKNPPELPREIMRQFRAMLRAMNLDGADYYVSEEWSLPEEKNLEPDAGME